MVLFSTKFLLEAWAQGLGSGFQNLKLSPQAIWALCDGSAQLRLFGLGSPGFRALGQALQTTTDNDSDSSGLDLVNLSQPHQSNLYSCFNHICHHQVYHHQVPQNTGEGIMDFQTWVLHHTLNPLCSDIPKDQEISNQHWKAKLDLLEH